jgi:hypothetical protein
MPYFGFSILSTQIKNTRSKHEDTDYLAFTLKLGSLTPETQVKSLGNLNSGVFNTPLSFNSYEVSIYDSVTINYLIVNAGSASAAQVEAALQTASAAWANGQGPASTNLVGALSDAQPWFNNELKSILNPKSCDGMVAAEQDHFQYGDLAAMIANGPFTHQTNHPGVRSPSGCGPNSIYTVTWQIGPDSKLI